MTISTISGAAQRRSKAAWLAVALLGVSSFAYATGNNNSPPSGAILDLGGGETATAAQSVNHGAPIQESVQFTAALTNTLITFAFREDPAFIAFSDPSLTNNTTPSGNLFANGNFGGGTYADPASSTDPYGNNSVPNGWSYANIYGASAQGTLAACGTESSHDANGYCWADGSVQAYDAIDQSVATTIGDTYTLSFWYTDNGHLSTMSDLSTNGDTTGTGGNGIDILAYAQAGLPPACTPGMVCGSVPEPNSLGLIGIGLAGIAGAMALRRRRPRRSI